MSLRIFERLLFLFIFCCFFIVWSLYNKEIDIYFFNSLLLLFISFFIVVTMFYSDRYVCSLNKLRKNLSFNDYVSYRVVENIFGKRLEVKINNSYNLFNFWNGVDCELLKIRENSCSKDELEVFCDGHKNVYSLYDTMTETYYGSHLIKERYDKGRVRARINLYLGSIILIISIILFIYFNMDILLYYWNGGYSF